MKAHLLGFRELNFTGSDGNKVEGTTLFVSYQETGVEGVATDKLFIKPEVEMPKGLEIGKQFQVFFNRRGKVEAITL